MSYITRRRPDPEAAAARSRGNVTTAPSTHPSTPVAPSAVPRWLPPVATVIALLGLGMSTYLTLTHYAAGAVPLACPATGGINCARVTTSPQSMIFGVPVALYGAVWWLLVLAVNVGPAWRSERWWVVLGRLGLAVAGIGFVIYLIYAELFLINAICLECTSVHVLTFLLFVLVLGGTAQLGWPGLGRQEEASA